MVSDRGGEQSNSGRHGWIVGRIGRQTANPFTNLTALRLLSDEEPSIQEGGSGGKLREADTTSSAVDVPAPKLDMRTKATRKRGDYQRHMTGEHEKTSGEGVDWVHEKSNDLFLKVRNCEGLGMR